MAERKPGLTPAGRGCLFVAVIAILVATVAAVYLFVIKPDMGPALTIPTPPVVAQQPLPTATPRSTQAQVIPTVAAGLPAKPVNPTATAVPVPESERPEICVAFDSFGSYFTAVDAASRATQYKPVLVPFYFDGTNEYDEAARAEMMRSGSCDILFTTADFLPRNGNVGVIPLFVDQSAGADKVVAWPTSVTRSGKSIQKFNDLSGLRIAFSEGSAGHFQVLALLRLVGIETSQVQLVPAASVADAVQLFVDKQVDAVAGWEPDIFDAQAVGGQVLVSSDWWRNISDVIVVSNNADATKRQAVLAFLYDWLASLRDQQQDLAGPAQTIANWRYNGQPSGDWTFVYDGSATDDMRTWLGPIAQAPLSSNVILFENSDFIVEQLEEARDIWAWGGLELPAFDVAAAIEPFYINQLATDASLQPAGGELVNSSFQPVPQSIERAGLEKLVDLPAFAELPCREFEYEPESYTLTQASREALQACTDPLRQLLKLSDTYLVVTGSAAWPLGSYTETHIRRFGRLRAIGIQDALVEIGVPIERTEVDSVLPPEQDRNSTDDTVLSKYRYVTLELKRLGR